MNARLLSIAAALVLSAASVAAVAQTSQDMQAQQSSEQAAPAKHHRLLDHAHIRITQSHNDSIYRGH